MEIILVRHGQTALNAARTFRGRLDVGLDETGRRQAAALGAYLAPRPLEAVYSSPLRRATETARAIARPHGLRVRRLDGLLDMDFGQWQGLTADEVRHRYPQAYADWLSAPHRVRVPGGEGLAEVRQRAVPAVGAVVSRHSGAVVLVSHRVVLKVLVCALLGLDSSHFWNIRLDTCGLTTFSYQDGRYVLAGHNDTSFLEGPGQGLPDF